jgi:hypothetical protein
MALQLDDDKQQVRCARSVCPCACSLFLSALSRALGVRLGSCASLGCGPRCQAQAPAGHLNPCARARTHARTHARLPASFTA